MPSPVAGRTRRQLSQRDTATFSPYPSPLSITGATHKQHTRLYPETMKFSSINIHSQLYSPYSQKSQKDYPTHRRKKTKPYWFFDTIVNFIINLCYDFVFAMTLFLLCYMVMLFWLGHVLDYVFNSYISLQHYVFCTREHGLNITPKACVKPLSFNCGLLFLNSRHNYLC